MADFNITIKKVFEVEAEGLTQVNGEEEITFTGIYRGANPNWIGWDLIDKYRNGTKLNMPDDEYQRLVQMTKEFYRQNYWNKIQGDKIKNQDLANEIMLGAVLSHPKTVTKLLQSTLGLNTDGIFGSRTLEAINKVSGYDFGTLWLISELKIKKLTYYTNLANKNKKYRKYIRGWNNRVLGLRG